MTTYGKIKLLDPKKDAWEIARFGAMYEFPWDFARSLELALFRTFAVPSISKILDNTGEFSNRPQKRYDDTDLILSEILEHGLESERGKAAIEKLNFIHSHFKISNEDFLYVLTTFVFEPIKWIDKYGYRKLLESEKIASYTIWFEIGTAMHIQNIPLTFDEFEKLNLEYEKKYFIFSEANQRVALATENLMLGWVLPKFSWNIARNFLHAIMDEPLLIAIGASKPSVLILFLVNATFSIRKLAINILPKRKNPFIRTSLTRPRTYPKGYTVPELGSIPYNKT